MTAGQTAGIQFGSLKQITEFGSVAFLIADAVATFVDLRLADETGRTGCFPHSACPERP